VSIYPEQICQISRRPEFSGDCVDGNAAGKAVSFVCGSFVRFGLRVNPSTKGIEEIRYSTNGCGFGIAAAETIAREFYRANLTELHGTMEIEELINARVTVFPKGRDHCLEMVVEAFRAALANYRVRVVEEFQGEKALICTCFGIPEEAIVNLIEEHRITDLSAFSEISNAGSGCGSCQMLIRELIEAPRN
jgi:NifU-like protein involved in Fe-S cluster formation/bacterioferritin-associated ferredoxin